VREEGEMFEMEEPRVKLRLEAEGGKVRVMGVAGTKPGAEAVIW
jgi:hypothetical protein